jgi:chemotaxis protein MotA
MFSLQSLSRPAVLAGIFGTLLLLSAAALSTNSFLAFFSLEGLLVVGGGVITVAFMSFQASDVRAALSAIGDMFREAPATHDNLQKDVLDILIWARMVREKGLIGLEANVVNKEGARDPFVRYGLNMVISDYSPAEVRAMLETAADSYDERACVPAHILQTMASHAPAFGMVGTLLGMVAMLCTLSENAANIGPTLAIAFLATLYGVLSARMIFMPAASRLMQKIDNMRFRNQLITEGLVMLVSNKSSIYIRDRLNSFLRPEIQESVDPVMARLQPVSSRAAGR